MGVDITVVIASANVVPTLSTPHLSCIVHEGKVFPNIFNSTITNQASIPMMRDVDHPRIDGSFPEQLNRGLDELTNNFRQIHHCDSSSSFSNVPIKALSLSKTKWCLQIMSIVNFLKCSTFVSVQSYTMIFTRVLLVLSSLVPHKCFSIVDGQTIKINIRCLKWGLRTTQILYRVQTM